MTTVQAIRADRDAFLENGQLSTDYLNRYNEVLMLLEMAAMDASMIDDLKAWRPMSYIEHFSRSELRCSAGAIAAYKELSPLAQQAFEMLCHSMNRLVGTIVQSVNQLKDPADAIYVLGIAIDSFKDLLSRATAFINSGGDLSYIAYDETALQGTVDRLMAQ